MWFLTDNEKLKTRKKVSFAEQVTTSEIKFRLFLLGNKKKKKKKEEGNINIKPFGEDLFSVKVIGGEGGGEVDPNLLIVTGGECSWGVRKWCWFMFLESYWEAALWNIIQKYGEE